MYLRGYKSARMHKYKERPAILLQYLGLRCLWVPEIHHLIQQLIDDDKVVPYTLLFQLFEVFGEDIDNLV
jgi:hypothetical protein